MESRDICIIVTLIAGHDT